MKKAWRNPVKDQPPSPETLAIEGEWGKFTADMKRILGQPKKQIDSPVRITRTGDIKSIGR
jgi:hypothetical protein